MQNFIGGFKDVLDSSEKIFRNISEERSEVKPSPEKWSSKEILGHLIDSSINNIRRLVLSQLQDNLIFSGYLQDDWVKIQNYQNREWNSLVDLWMANNLHLINIVEQIPVEIWGKKFSKHNFNEILSESFSPDQQVTIEMMMRDYLYHMRHHIDQIYKQADAN